MLPCEEGTTATAVRLLTPDLSAGEMYFDVEQNVKPEVTPAAAQPDIRALTRAVKRGEAEAFSLFYDLYSFRLYKFLLVLARGDEHEAREMCQAAFIKLAKRCEVFDDERKLWAWLCVLARNLFIDHCRSQQRRNRFESLDALPAEPSRQSEPEHQLGEVLREALSGLSADERELLQAAYVDKRPLQELADEAGLTYKAVESRLGRLRQKLKEQLLKDLRRENES
jgi:RNA polymerase sigma-70 factor, ECF subfamily